MSVDQAVTKRPLRADAERNRQRILDAAAEVFAERGLHVCLDDVAARAGVGVGTVYRRFADRETLINAMFESRIEELVGLAEEAARNPDPWQGLLRFIEQGAEFHGRNRALRELMFSAPGGRDWVDGVRERVRPVIDGVVAAAQAQGKLRPDFDTIDVPIIELTLATTIAFTEGVGADSWRRVLTIIVDGLRADREGPTPLESDPLSHADFVRALEHGTR